MGRGVFVSPSPPLAGASVRSCPSEVSHDAGWPWAACAGADVVCTAALGPGVGLRAHLRAA